MRFPRLKVWLVNEEQVCALEIGSLRWERKIIALILIGKGIGFQAESWFELKFLLQIVKILLLCQRKSKCVN